VPIDEPSLGNLFDNLYLYFTQDS